MPCYPAQDRDPGVKKHLRGHDSLLGLYLVIFVVKRFYLYAYSIHNETHKRHENKYVFICGH